jgi:hypothetical protein
MIQPFTTIMTCYTRFEANKLVSSDPHLRASGSKMRKMLIFVKSLFYSSKRREAANENKWSQQHERCLKAFAWKFTIYF